MNFRVPDMPERRLLVECKRSDDDGYRRDSVYKALAYLRDFTALWTETRQRPKAIVVFPGSLELKNRNGRGESDLVLVGAEDRDRMVGLLSGGISD